MASDQIVDPKDVLNAVMEVRRLGRERMLRDLEAREPVLAEFVMEESSAVFQELSLSGTKPRRMRRVTVRVETLALVAVESLRHAYRRLLDQEGDEDLPGPALNAGADEPASAPHPPTEE